MTRPITPAVLDEHDALREAATPGPWSQGNRAWPEDDVEWGPDWRVYQVHPDPDETHWVHVAGDGVDGTIADAAYITTLANDDAAMCARVRELEAALEEIAKHTRIGRVSDGCAWCESTTEALIARAALNPEQEPSA